ncbi:hypothetical protein F4778DRAFT_655142 [Xylariomycetidae sp. FL2044]|nr:hypothetical protein F4778DRAFT_655142 [Xylariomycetidae sp. FL2044]
MEVSRIFVKGLPPSITEADLRKHFATKGNITDIRCIPKRRIGYVGFKDSQQAKDAVKYFNRSFIRMSKISVELAKPVADPSLSTSKTSSHYTRVSNVLPAVEDSTHTTNPENEKKRKRESPDESDPKLQEFLGVMQPPKHMVNKMQTVEGVPNLDPTNAPVLEAEQESDDEYEVVPKRQKKSPAREFVKPARAPQGETFHTQEKESHLSHTDEDQLQGSEPSGNTLDSTDGGVPENAAATDDDWLRRRTNRLLDLVDDDDPIPHATPPMMESNTPPPAETRTDHADEDDDTPDEASTQEDKATGVEETEDTALSSIRKTKRLFIRNLPYSATEDDLRSFFEQYGILEEVHVPTDKSKNNRGMGFVLFTSSDDAARAFQNLDRSPFMGRILHILASAPKRDHNLDEFALKKLPLKQQNILRKRAEAASTRFNWNSLYLSQDAVNTSVADRLGISKSEFLDPTNSSAAVTQAIAETSTILDTKAFFAANGVDLNAFKSGARGDTAILVKNFAYDTTAEELRNLFEEHGQVLKVLMPPTGGIAIVQFASATEGRRAFTHLAYRRFKESPLFLEKAPKDIFVESAQTHAPHKDQPAGVQKLSAAELMERDEAQDPAEGSALFVKNLHWDTTSDELAATFRHLEGFRSAQVRTRKDPKKPGQLLSMGFGFVSFSSPDYAQSALKVMDGYVLRAHKIQVRASHRGRDAAEERRREDNAKKTANKHTKVVLKNVPFEATKKDIRTLLSSYGQLKSVRIPKKYNSKSKGFAFADFVSPREAESAMEALKDTHLLGRRLILQYAEAETIDPEEEIAKMQQKVGRQANKVALQQLTGGGRKKVTLGGDEDEGEV